jgi:L-alanine-DL-glutamate epimerase-like enolase superfamily enzyme
MRIEFRRVEWQFASMFRISYRARTHAEGVVAELNDGNAIGRGEAFGVSYHGETVDSVLAQLMSVKQDLVNGLSRFELQTRLPPGGARNAVDCALWDLEAKRTGRRAWDLAGMPSMKPLTTYFTIGLDTPAAMGHAAAAVAQYSKLKLKLAGDQDLERVRAVREARPDAELIVDPNQAWDEGQLRELAPRFAELGVKLIEQPFPVGRDAMLVDFESSIPLCADESCQTTESLPALLGKYRYINIKLDKTGGLTEALRLAQAARAANLRLMVGSMAGGSSLSMAPAFIVGQLCDFVDLDGPLLSTSDVPNAIRYEGNNMSVPQAGLWG